jgi:hypothetical protein
MQPITLHFPAPVAAQAEELVRTRGLEYAAHWLASLSTRALMQELVNRGALARPLGELLDDDSEAEARDYTADLAAAMDEVSRQTR